MVVSTHLEICVWGLLGGVICIHSVTFSLTECFSQIQDEVCLQDQSGCFTHIHFFCCCFSLYKYEWISLNGSPLNVADGKFAIKHPSCAFIMLQRAGRKTKTQWAGGASSEVTHTTKCGLFGMMAQVFISFYSSSSWGFFFCVFFPLPISAFCLTLHLLSSSYSNKTQLLPFCQSPGTGWSFWGLCFMCFTWSFIGKRVFYIFDLLQRGVTWGGFCSGNIFSLKKNYTFHQCNISA